MVTVLSQVEPVSLRSSGSRETKVEKKKNQVLDRCTQSVPVSGVVRTVWF